ncbi:MAG: radical SAM family heme chaperone HemW [Bacteroidetes bacterium]|nr:radical SAM family heme chaperone HemW [Bacteroidota bacterium]MBP6313917.1 radical SAM family heme chaperone HemW [Chitinophagaceae bacterium]
MAGIYVHIPFCKKACHYCDFHFSTSLQHKNEIIESILLELEMQQNYLGDEEIRSIYFGGGTPSLLSGDEIGSIIQQIHTNFNVSDRIECTLEANPDDLSDEKLRQFAKAGVNRLSIGIQSFFDEDLQYMNRSHDAAQAEHCIALAYKNGISNFSIDLIFGYPLLSDEKWKRNIEKVIEFGVPHISCYGMTVEPKTALASMIAKQKVAAMDDGQSARQYEYLMEVLCSAGYEHYEISNFSKKGYASMHNSSYWQQQAYLGIGPSAHSYNGWSRQWNVSNNALYIKGIASGILPYESEILNRENKINEWIMVSLRTAKGLVLNTLKELLTDSERISFTAVADKFVLQGLLRQEANADLQLTQKGKLFADHIASELFIG